VNKNPSLVVFVLGIAADVSPLLNERALYSKLSGEPLGKDKSGKTGADD
jgi:hypothetical protein